MKPFIELKYKVILVLILGVLIPIILTTAIMFFMKPTLTELFVAFVLILILDGIVLVSWTYKSIVAPLKMLTSATKSIAEGNLDFQVEIPAQNDELSSLCRDFEQMRLKLKESTHVKMENENENRVLISNITHDLKTPVTSIKGYAEGIIDGVADTPEKMDRYIRTIYTKANDMDRLINELTFYSGIDANRIPYNFTKIHIVDYFDDCVDEISMDLEASNIELHYDNYLDPDVSIIADPIQMKKVINNIVGNSIKYMDKEKSVLCIRLKDADTAVHIEIQDNGKGISPKNLPYIFDRFFRTDSSRNSSKGGSGIGLSIVKKIVEDHGGRVWAVSQSGVGTTMIMEFRKYIHTEDTDE
ncbi:MAG: HAMP domain-containing histidine kinase [Lachnospiraceae bacterium]|nr:HAMP domain-containing histidine kinase [Lachnospiraceae bacterium]